MNATVGADSEREEDVADVEEALAKLDPGDDDSNRLRRRLLLRRFWKGAFGFCGRGGDRLSLLLPGVILLTIILNLAVAYGMNVWNRAIFDALERRNARTVLFLSIIYFPLLATSVTLVVLLVYPRMTTQRRWRAWLNNHLLDRWLTNGRYYQLNLVSGDHKNPEYRIADDVRVAAEAPVEFATGVTTAVLSAAMFIVVLWTIGGALSLTLGGITISIPGFLVIAAVIYALLASGSATTIVSVGHRPELEAFHSRKIVLERRRGGARFVTDINLIPRPGRKRLLKRWLARRRGQARKRSTA